MAMILAFAGSNSSTSINFKLLRFTTGLLKDHQVQLLDMSHFPFPMYSADHEKEQGFTNALGELLQDIRRADALIIAVNEHNGGPSAYFKNLLDWLSRVNGKFLEGKKILLLSTSPGKRGGMSSLARTKEILPRFGGEITASFSLPSFFDNFDVGTGITDQNLAMAHREALDTFLQSI